MFCFLDQIMYIFVNIIIGRIIPVFTILSCPHVAFCINHYIVIRICLACFFVLLITYLLLSLVVMFNHAYSCHIVAHALHSFSLPSKSQWSVKACTTFLVACVGYHGNNYKQTMIGFIYFFLSTMIESCMNMVPNALLIRKGGLSSILFQFDKYVCHA